MSDEIKTTDLDDLTSSRGHTKTRRVDDRLECVVCGEIALWCQCQPFPFADAELTEVETSFRKYRETATDV
jgi:hypothetical protein